MGGHVLIPWTTVLDWVDVLWLGEACMDRTRLAVITKLYALSVAVV